MNFPTLIAEDLIAKESCLFLLDGITDCNFKPYHNAESYRPEDNNDMFNNDPSKHGRFKNIILELSAFVEKHYATKVLNIYGNVFMKYENTQNINLHQDYDVNDPHEAAKEPFKLSSVFYLNEDYEGGKLIFPYKSNANIDNRVNKLEFIPKQGSVIFFDSTLEHYTLPVVKGTKYVITNFYDISLSN